MSTAAKMPTSPAGLRTASAYAESAELGTATVQRWLAATGSAPVDEFGRELPYPISLVEGACERGLESMTAQVVALLGTMETSEIVAFRRSMYAWNWDPAAPAWDFFGLRGDNLRDAGLSATWLDTLALGVLGDRGVSSHWDDAR